MDRKGLAVAVLFLAAVALWGQWRAQREAQQVSAWQKQVNLSAEIDIRPGVKGLLEEESTQPLQSLAGATAALNDPSMPRHDNRLKGRTNP